MAQAETSTQLLLFAGAIGAVSFVVVWAVEGTTRAGYRPSEHPVSALALGERGWVQIASFVGTGAAMALGALGIHRALGAGPAALWGSSLLGVCGLGLVASGIFVMDPPVGYPPGASVGLVRTWHGVAHDLAGLVVFTTLPASALVLAGRFWATERLHWLGAWSLASGLLTGMLFLAYAIVDTSGGGGAGLLQRGAIVVGWGWVAVVAIALAAAPETSG